MMGYVEAPKAWGLTNGMARTLGVSLPQAVLDGWLTRAELATLVGRCQICGKSEDCTAWLASVTVATQLPAYCPNKDEIEALAPGN
ncbi:MAG: DUF6455 family protein [Paracoccaceae bacterium]